MAQKDILDLKQEKRTVEYTNKEGEKVTQEVTLNTPSYPDALDINDLTQGPNGFRDYGEAYARTMDKVLVNPRMDYKSVNEAIEKNGDNKGEITFDDKKGENVKLAVVFPNAREAVNLTMNFIRSDGSANMRQTIQTLNEDVFRDENGKALTWDYWQEHGNVYAALTPVIDYLNTGLAHAGFLAIVGKAFSFLQEQI